MNSITIKNKVIGEGLPKIIVPLTASGENELLQEIEDVHTLHPDIIEWRVDVYEHVDSLDAVKDMIQKVRKAAGDTPLLFTFRSHKEGGKKVIEDSFYVKLVKTAIETKQIDLVDVELFTGEAEVKSIVATAEANGVYVVMSNHDFHKTPEKEEIISRLRKMQEYGAHIPKIAVMPQSTEDVLVLLDATHTMKTKYADRPIITMSMAGTGLISRLAGEVFGSACTFGAGKEASAPGQIPVDELRSVLTVLNKNM
ncbi:type I 3-dehydroquinate dehydratase [Bacillus sp. ISL-51]|uniref:type I 3-dehydroquinate dehydratase n=1 Tax=Bacteria TaxID=2 RepID=UPI001BE57ECC|nr:MULTISPECIES: type I 3-dehydroquinate dehydratase [Bacteria]MBT2572454.1 type I 3-dehydroquinate dehydratase [Bacillus sp. ISL-51]MBT2634389.1 type I 3-dehydroquinate dehydratase [Bacillus sp. ISL-26]MBT2711519.1 type I 3-dehydroquinate dehydratase [Pseudomonas sp. ISL-88]